MSMFIKIRTIGGYWLAVSVSLLVAYSGAVASFAHADQRSVYHEVRYELSRAGARPKRGRLVLPEGRAATVILNNNTLLRFRSFSAAEGKIQVETEIWDRREGSDRELVAKPLLLLEPGKSGEFEETRPGYANFLLEVVARSRLQEAVVAVQEEVEEAGYERVSTSLFAPRRQSWDE